MLLHNKFPMFHIAEALKLLRRTQGVKAKVYIVMMMDLIIILYFCSKNCHDYDTIFVELVPLGSQVNQASLQTVQACPNSQFLSPVGNR